MKKLFFASVTCTLLFLFSGCDKLKEYTTIKVDVPDLELSFDEIEVKNQESTLRADTYSYFEWLKSISIDDFGASLKKYDVSHFKGITSKSASIRVYSTSGDNGKVEDLRIETTGSSPLTFTINSYVLGTTYSNGDFKTFVEQLMFKMITQPSVTFKISGKTDIPEGSKIAATISVLDITVAVQVLKD